MNVFGNYNYNQYIPQSQANYMAHMYQLSEYYNQNYFYPNPNLRYEVEQIYHYDPTAYVATNTADRYYVYDPVFKKKCGEEAALEEILKKNPDVWNKYRTGKFSVKLENYNGVKKIILKERNDGDSDYRIKKYKVRVNKCKDEVMLLSYSHDPNPQQFDPQLPIVHHNQPLVEQTASMHQPQIPPQIQAPIQPVPNQIQPDLLLNPSEPYINGPGAELVSRIVDGNDSFSPSATGTLGPLGNVQVLNQAPILQPILQPAPLPTLLPLQPPQPQIIQTVFAAQPGVSLTQLGQAVQEPNYYQSYNEKVQDYQTNQSNQAGITPIGLQPQSVTPKEMFEDETLNEYNTIKSSNDKSSKKISNQAPGRKNKNTAGSDRLFGSVKEALQTLNSNEDYQNANTTPKSMNSGRNTSNTSNFSNTKTSTSKRSATTQSIQNKISNALNDQSGEIEWEQSTSVEELDLLPKDGKSRIHGIDNVNIERRSVRDTFLKSGERSSIAYTASQVEANQETLSIGPISMAGGSLYGGDYTYDTAMQSQVNNDAKSAFSEYSLGKENNETTNFNDQYNSSNLKRIL